MKVFGCGLNKTGTKTLGQCLQRLGFRHISCRRDLLAHFRAGDLKPVWAVADTHQSFEDWPWPLIYRELHERYGEESRFILTTRVSPDIWLRSLKAHSLKTSPGAHCRLMAYGYNYPHGAEAEHLEIYRRHNEAVRRYFAKYPGQFLDVCWENGDGWGKLCGFLGRAAPDEPFPHANRTKEAAGSPAVRAANLALIERQLAELAGRRGASGDLFS
jgi:hypothetical protein